jgi:hypothetical protein
MKEGHPFDLLLAKGEEVHLMNAGLVLGLVFVVAVGFRLWEILALVSGRMEGILP